MFILFPGFWLFPMIIDLFYGNYDSQWIGAKIIFAVTSVGIGLYQIRKGHGGFANLGDINLKLCTTCKHHIDEHSGIYRECEKTVGPFKKTCPCKNFN